MRQARLLLAGLAIGCLGIGPLASPLASKKLDKPICDDLKVEQGLLQQKGVAADLAKGPDWAKANASRDRLKEIERLIFVEEQLAFRCPQPKKPLAPREDDDGNVTSATAKPKGTAQGQGGAQPKAAAAKPAPKTATTSETGATTSAPPKKVVKAATAEQPVKEAAPGSAPPASKPKPKPKVEDAYSPGGPGDAKPSKPPQN